ncbi:claudin domain-containing protein 2 isoform X1 [Gorilla gorilla gorilla]|uniref:claudin domain-containing protein 2 isoform X1 n=1 Tax=Gorilla gorilla gorilla TaxID=9595 RepID=UPI00244593EC|nr:claudin domain-containing protein 2 isoform X1 [Gorilla gorilla gorilla]XP_055226222.1 claudin domain-containing protein 2 isoform X1 [Gorilla gorilla gorilla]
MGVKRSLQSGGILLSLVANVLMVLSTATNYWTRQQEGHSGLWQECNHGICSSIPCQTTLAVTVACMVLAVGVGVVGMVMGLRIRCDEGESLRGQTTSAFLFLGGLLLLTALIGYTVKNAWKNNVFFSWSYFSGWLALPFSILAGNLDSGKRVEETAQKTLTPEAPQLPSQETPGTSRGLPNTLTTPADPAETPLEPQTPVPGALPAIRPRAHLPLPAPRPRPPRLLLSAGRHDHAEHRRHQWIPRVSVTAACLGQNKGTAFF